MPKPRSGEIQPVAPERPIRRTDPPHVRLIDPPLVDEVLDEAPNGVVGEGGHHGGVEPEQRLQTRATLYSPPPSQALNVRAVVDATSPGSKRRHHFTEGDKIETAVALGLIVRSWATPGEEKTVETTNAGPLT